MVQIVSEGKKEEFNNLDVNMGKILWECCLSGKLSRLLAVTAASVSTSPASAAFLALAPAPVPAAAARAAFLGLRVGGAADAEGTADAVGRILDPVADTFEEARCIVGLLLSLHVGVGQSSAEEDDGKDVELFFGVFCVQVR